jgi:hypothetical protein
MWWDLKMQSADRSRLSGESLVILHKIAADAHVSEVGPAKRFQKVTARIGEFADANKNDIGDRQSL